MEKAGSENVLKRIFRASNEMLLKKLKSGSVQKSQSQSFS